LFKAMTSIGANAAEAAAGQSKADFLAKLGVARKESREAIFWLRLIQAKRLLAPDVVSGDLAEAIQIAAVLTAIVRAGRASDQRGET
jgi:four helix bundle protein